MAGITKSTRHSRIIGKTGEWFLCNWLSRSGFEVSIVDHTGIDLIAYDRASKRRLGITVKSRTRNEGKERTQVNLLSYRKKNNDRKKVRAACKAFACEPWVAVFVETTKGAHLYMTSLKHYDRMNDRSDSRTLDTWGMKDQDIQRYQDDPDVWHVGLSYVTKGWVLPKPRTARRR